MSSLAFVFFVLIQSESVTVSIKELLSRKEMHDLLFAISGR